MADGAASADQVYAVTAALVAAITANAPAAVALATRALVRGATVQSIAAPRSESNSLQDAVCCHTRNGGYRRMHSAGMCRERRNSARARCGAVAGRVCTRELDQTVRIAPGTTRATAL